MPVFISSNSPAKSISMLSGGGTYANVQAQGVVTYVNNNSLKINLAKSESGYAYIKK